jgi:hypothetical protein
MKYGDKHRCTLVEFEDFRRFADKNLTAWEYEELTAFLSIMPEEGAVIPGTGGLRKLRWAAKGKGKSGGVRVIYYYHDMDMPLLLLTGYAKNVQADMTPAQKKQMQGIIPLLVKAYRGKK